MKFLICNDPRKLRQALEGQPSVTIEAKFGQDVVQGSLLTMGSYGPDRKPACCYANGCVDGVEVVGLTHLDLNVLAGCMALLGVKPEAPSFWQLVEFVERNGSHMLSQSGASKADIRRLYACWALLKNFPLADDDVTDFIKHAIKVVADGILPETTYSAERLIAGDTLGASLEQIGRETFVQIAHEVLVRVGTTKQYGELAGFGEFFLTPSGEIAKAVIYFDTLTGSISLLMRIPNLTASILMRLPDLTASIDTGCKEIRVEGVRSDAQGNLMSVQADKRAEFLDLGEVFESVQDFIMGLDT